MLKHDGDGGECDSGKHRALATGFEKSMGPPGGGGRSIRKAGGETAIPNIGRWEDRPKQTNSDRRSISGGTGPATSQTVPSNPLQPTRNSIVFAVACRAGRRRGVPARRSGRATAAARKRRADRCG